MKKSLAVLSLIVLSLFAFVSLAGAAGPVYLRDYDSAQYEAIVDYYVDAGFSEADAIAAAERITVPGVTLEATPAPTPTPTATPTPELTPTSEPEPIATSSTGTCTQEEWEAVIIAAVDSGTPPLLSLEVACDFTVSP